MHFPALLADQGLTQLQHSSQPEATRTSSIQISCILLVALGMVAKIAFAVESLDWWDYAVLCFLTGIWYSRRPTTYVVL
ncbi:hypothetical protein EYC84_000713 [Monilinia fructicola]|uniref:Uncharacterized protein n=1 Tax=Monilinia fructicola TaxID=38448 RepID=A0A5M9JK58_MONFR|nr:hypothetical protein EYC84_000713 [Monilinia fructicola]